MYYIIRTHNFSVRKEMSMIDRFHVIDYACHLPDGEIIYHPRNQRRLRAPVERQNNRILLAGENNNKFYQVRVF